MQPISKGNVVMRLSSQTKNPFLARSLASLLRLLAYLKSPLLVPQYMRAVYWLKNKVFVRYNPVSVGEY